MGDETEDIRRAQQAHLNAKQAQRTVLEANYGKIWDADELREDFEILGFMTPYVVARERKTGKKGRLQFQHDPRFYFNFQAD